jgi:Tfp pilus assembly protein PilO
MTRRYLVAGAVALGVILLFFLVLLKPKFAQITEVRTQIEDAQATTDSLRIRLAQLEQAQRNQLDTLARLARFNSALPSTPDLPSLIRQLQTVADVSGMDLQSIAPSPPSKLPDATGVDVVNVNLQVTGGFFRLESFLTRLEDLSRVIEVRSIAVAPQTDPVTGLTTLSSTISFQMYVVQANAKVTAKAAPRAAATPTPAPTATSTTSASPSPTPTSTR